MSLLRIHEDHPPGHGQQQDLPCHSWVTTNPLWDHGSSRKECCPNTKCPGQPHKTRKVPSPVSHACFGCPFSQGMGSASAQLLATLAPQGQCSWQKEKLNQPQLLCLLNSTRGEEGDTSAPKVLQRRLGNIHFPLGFLAAAGVMPDRVPHWWHGAAEHLSDASYLVFLTALAHESQFWLEMGKVCPTELGCKRGLSHSEAGSQLSGFAPVVCQILSIHRKMMKNISVSLWLSSS